MIRKGKISDVVEIQKLINFYAKKDKMLPRSLGEIYENIRDYVVVEARRKIVGCCALHILWEDLAEIKSLVVKKSYQKRGYGRELVKFCLEEAKELGVKKIFSLTYIPEFFEKLGFKKVPKDVMPRKVWIECTKCPKFPDCGEVPVIYEIR
jgi:amino-acid N-acetyltransferase